MTNLTAQDVLDALRNPAIGFSKEQINEGFDLLKVRNNSLQAVAALMFSVGDKVEFDSRGATHTGVVTKINQKTVAVKVDWQSWKVSPSLLRAAAQA